MIAISVTIILLYSVCILLFIKGFDQLKIYKIKNTEPLTNFSIIIPFRNEAENLPDLLNSLRALNYSNKKFEILMIDDGSNDDFEEIINQFKNKELDINLIENIRSSNSPKKDAIALGIKKSKFEWIVCTDADCTVPKDWLKTIDDFIQNESPKMIIAPVSYQVKNNFLNKFQNLDFLSLQGSTIGGFGINKPFLCNGANLSYSKKAFIEVDAFKGNENIASGDDIFLLEKMIKHYPNQVKYLKSIHANVTTKPQENLRQLIQQRIRWASKTTAYKNTFGKLVGLIVLTTNTFLLLLFVLAIVKSVSWQTFGLFFLIKFNVDFFLLYKTSLFFNQQESLKIYFTSSVLHPIFTIFIAFLSFKKSYHWKGRQFNK